MSHSGIRTLLIALATAGAGTASAADMLTINSSTDELVAIDTSTGQVTAVGSLGRPLTNRSIDLTVMNGTVYALAHNPSNVTTLYTIDPVTGPRSPR